MSQKPPVDNTHVCAAILEDLRRQDVALKKLQACTADLVGFAR
jgi:hypothetical protein